MASSLDVTEVAVGEANDHYWLHALNQRARLSWYVVDAGYNIEVIDNNGLMRALSWVKWPTPNPSGSTAVNLIDGPATGLLRLAVKNLPSYIPIKPLLSFLKDTFCDAGLVSTAAKSNLIDGDHEEGTLFGSSKGKDPICDIREGTLQP
ncbi:ABC transporter B family member 2 [Hordeum vulgare]|nr:ABC transporter B family member 2 [Hordeum vulgare]